MITGFNEVMSCVMSDDVPNPIISNVTLKTAEPAFASVAATFKISFRINRTMSFMGSPISNSLAF